MAPLSIKYYEKNLYSVLQTILQCCIVISLLQGAIDFKQISEASNVTSPTQDIFGASVICYQYMNIRII